MEHWKPVPGYEEFYEVSNHGRFRSLRRKKIMTPYPSSRSRGRWPGYPVIGLYGPESRTQRLVSRVVAEAFLGDLSGLQVHHIDRDPWNNHIDNLQLLTPQEHRAAHA